MEFCFALATTVASNGVIRTQPFRVPIDPLEEPKLTILSLSSMESVATYVKKISHAI